MSLSVEDILLVSPMIFLLLASMVPIMVKVFRGNKEFNHSVSLAQGFGILVLTGFTLIAFRGDGSQYAFMNSLVFDGFSFWASLGGLSFMALSIPFLAENPSTQVKMFSEQLFLLLNVLLGAFLLVSANDLIMVFIGVEAMSLALYLAIAMGNEQTRSKEAAFKYFVLGSFASAVFLYGVAFLFGAIGTTNLSEIAAQMSSVTESRFLLFGLMFVVVGLGFKVSLFPFHFWTADVYQGAPSPLTSIMATTVKMASFVAFFRIVNSLQVENFVSVVDVLQWLAVFTMIFGNVSAILQNNLKRVLAFSSVAHSGYLLIGIVAATQDSVTLAGMPSFIFYLIAYGVSSVGTFGLISILESRVGHTIDVTDLSGLAKTHPGMALCLTILLLSLAGMPPTLGFFGKFYFLYEAFGAGLTWLVIWALINSVVSVYYYLRPIVMMYMHEPTEETVVPQQGISRLVFYFVSIFTVVFGIFSYPLYSAIRDIL